jgi:hypothetical protein
MSSSLAKGYELLTEESILNEPIPNDLAFILNQIANDEPNNEVAQTIHVVDPNSRFKSYTDIDKFIFENENENTRKKTLRNRLYRSGSTVRLVMY